MPQRLVIACLFLLAAGGAFGAGADDGTPKGHPSIAEILKDGGGCVPKDNTARILKSANPLDYAPNWSGKNYLGLAWSFVPKRYVVTADRGRHLPARRSHRDARRHHRQERLYPVQRVEVRAE